MEWDLSKIYPTREDWEKDLAELPKKTEALVQLKGTLHTPQGLKKLLYVEKNLDTTISKLFSYASMKYDLNQKDIECQMDYQKVYHCYNELSKQASFVSPELISVGKESVMKMIEADEELQVWRYRMKSLFRNREHYLDEKSETLLARVDEATGGFNLLYDQLAVADNHSSEVVLSNGKVLEISESNFQYYLGLLENQEDRRKVFEAVYRFYEEHRNTFAGIYCGIMQSEKANAQNRGYSSILESHLFYQAIPTEVFHSLIDTTRKNTKPLKEYYALRKKYFHLEHYHTYDRFLSFAKSDKKYEYETCKQMVLDACASLGKDYYEHALKALEPGRVSVRIKDGKRTGAYSTSLYEEGTFILLNHNDNLDSAFTVAHEAGHSIHSLYANEHQPQETANYTIFVAEIASTFNEQLFLDYLISHTEDSNEKIVLLQQAIDNIVATYYRQTLFADFEFSAHQKIEEGIPVTSSELQKIMEELYETYYGIDLKEEPYKNNVWAYIPHFFHSPFYVYQYATSFAASMAIYEKVKSGEKNAFENYIQMLSAGGNGDPIEIVRKAGVDLTKADAFSAVVHRLQELVNELKQLLNL